MRVMCQTSRYMSWKMHFSNVMFMLSEHGADIPWIQGVAKDDELLLSSFDEYDVLNSHPRFLKSSCHWKYSCEFIESREEAVLWMFGNPKLEATVGKASKWFGDIDESTGDGMLWLTPHTSGPFEPDIKSVKWWKGTYVLRRGCGRRVRGWFHDCFFWVQMWWSELSLRRIPQRQFTSLHNFSVHNSNLRCAIIPPIPLPSSLLQHHPCKQLLIPISPWRRNDHPGYLGEAPLRLQIQLTWLG